MKNTKTASSTCSENLREKTIRAKVKPYASTAPKVILCDLGNVLINFDHRIAVKRLLPYSKKSFHDIYQLIFDSKLTKDYEEGRISSREFFKRLSGCLALRKMPYKKFVSIWNEIFFDNKGMPELLSALKKKYRLYLVSNINELHYLYILEKFPRHLRLFDKVILSCRVGKRKPAPEIYLQAIEAAGVDARFALYTDDRPDLIDAAKKIGIPSVLFKGVKDFRAKLKKLKVLP